MHVILLILKVIGIILLSILGLLLAILLAVLFVPIRYKISGESHETYFINASVSWLLHLIHAGVHFDAEKILKLRIRLLGIPIIKRDIDLFKKNSKAKSDDEFDWDMLVEEDSEKSKGPEPEKKEPVTTVSSEAKEKDVKKKAAKDKTPKKDTGNTETSKAEEICAKIEQTKKKAADFWEFIQSETFTGAFIKLKKELLRILKVILPRKATAHLIYGFENPETTGKALGYLSILNAHIPAKVVLIPDFDKPIIEGDGSISGAISLICILIPAVSLLLNRNVRACIKQFRKK